jgi:hypothetical protein
MKLIALPDIGFSPFNWKWKYDFTDVDDGAGGTTVTKQVFPDGNVGTTAFDAGLAVINTGFNLITAFDASDAAVNSLLIEVGDGGDTDRLLTQTETALDGTEVLFKMMGAVTAPFAYVVADTIDALFTVAGGATPTLGEVNAGAAEVYLHLFDLNRLEIVL